MIKRRKLQITILILLCFLIACSNKKKHPSAEMQNSQIVLIFNSPPPNWREYRKDSAYRPAQCEIYFIDDHFISKKFIPDSSIESDTFTLHTNRKLVEFIHSHKGLDELSYIFQNGDTVLFTYQDKTPIAKILNRETKSLDINFELYKRQSLSPNDYPAYIKIKFPHFFMENSKNFTQADEFRQEIKRVSALANEQFEVELIKEKELLDSLHQNNFISEEIYYFFVTKLKYQRKTAYLNRLLDAKKKPNNFSELSPDDFKIQLGYDQELGWINSGNILDSKNDSLLYFGFHNNVINLIYYKYLSRKVRRIETTNYVNNIATAGSVMPDYIALYDTLNECNLLSPLAKKILSFTNIQSTIENNSINEAKLAFKKFENDFNDTSMLSYIRNNYLLTPESLTDSADLVLTSIDSENINYNKLIEKHRGNVLYVDFWSSGCSPCFEQFKFSDTLHHLYKDKNLVQIYISHEPDKRRWLNASKKYNLDPESYLVVNRYTSQQLENMNIKFVPHYLIYDQKGNLVNDFAPRPSEKSLIQILDKYLNE
ncbi:MAG: hypothetical protein CVU00_00900 [Bacteroidetes bacterium HGW-Bacteroidetes-17]|nr:MAG: hypothetical protein CVU00_00900 [Bacteroidetes bacterium HGW-Bacteroidetes-17]